MSKVAINASGWAVVSIQVPGYSHLGEKWVTRVESECTPYMYVDADTDLE